MSIIDIEKVREGQTTLEDTSLDAIIPELITEAEDLVIVQLSYLDDINDLVRPTAPDMTPDAINLLVLYKARALSYESYYGSAVNEQSKLWNEKYDSILKDIRRNFIVLPTTNTTQGLGVADFG